MKPYYSVLDTGFTKLLPQAQQNLICRDYAQSQLNGSVAFYWTEDMLTLKSMDLVIKNIHGPFQKSQGLIFFRLWQFCYNGKFNFKVLEDILKSGLEVHFAREKVSIFSFEHLEKVKPLIITYALLEIRDHKRAFCQTVLNDIKVNNNELLRK